MTSIEKVGFYLNSFDLEDPNYDFACYIKEKLAEQQAQVTGNGMHEEDNNESAEVNTPEVDKTEENLEGKLMEGAFKDLDVLNQLNEEKEQIKTSELLAELIKRLRSN
jgi:hypothetical protein